MELLEKPLQTEELENSGFAFKCGTENMLTTESLENNALIIIIIIIIIIIFLIYNYVYNVPSIIIFF